MKNESNKKQLVTVAISGAVIASGFGGVAAYAALTATSTLTQSITAGTLSTSIRDAAGAVVASPTFAMSALTASTTQQTSTGTFGSSTQRITVDNPGGASSGWTLALNGTTPASSKWTSGSNSYSYNGASAAVGQLTVNPTAGAITPVIGTATGVTLGASATFNSATAVTLISAAATSDDIWNGYATGIGLSQTVPAGQATGTYSLPMTQTVTAL